MQGAPALTEIYREKTRSFSSEKFTFMDVVSTILFLVFSVVAIYFGWKLGGQYGPYFWAVIQAIGSAIRSYIIQLIVYAQEYARRSR
jgi:hypothetical protein